MRGIIHNNRSRCSSPRRINPQAVALLGMDVRGFFRVKKRALEMEGVTVKTKRGKTELASQIYVNRSPVMILWGAVCGSFSQGLKWEEALSVASAAASVIAGQKAALLELGGWGPAAGDSSVGLLGVRVSVTRTEAGMRGMDKNGEQVEPRMVRLLLETKFECQLNPLKVEMERVARTYAPECLLEDDGRLVYLLYVRFRPRVPLGRAGWGAKGNLDTARLKNAENDEATRRSGDTASAARRG